MALKCQPMSDDTPPPAPDPLEYPGFLPVLCAHGKLTAWVSDPPTWDPPPTEPCPDCVVIIEPAA